MVPETPNESLSRRRGPRAESPLVRIVGVSKVYPGGATALDNATLEVRPDEFIVVVGPSGAGKSTMLRCMNLLVRPTSGTLEVDGETIRGQHGSQLRSVRGKVGMIFQQFGLVGRLSVFQNVLAGRLRFHTMDSRPARRLGAAAAAGIAVLTLLLMIRAVTPVPTTLLWAVGIPTAVLFIVRCVLWCWKVGPSVVRIFPAADKQAAMDALTAVGIAHLADRRADQLSGGQQQRVAIARTLAQDPTVVLADEPIASLDPVSAEGVMDSLQRINRERGIPVVVNLHQVDVARRYATRIIGMSAGRIIFDGPPDQLSPEVVDRIYRGGPRQAAAVATEDPAFDADSGCVVITIDHPHSATGAGNKEQAWIPSPAS
jgi:phosphonate transport system ATP-binding protein